MEAREGSSERDQLGHRAGEVTLSDLVLDALRMNLRRIIVGEVRGPEVLPMLEAMSTGDGSMCTIHARTATHALDRIVTLCLAALRAGQPTAAEIVALICSTLVVTAQVVAAGMRWSIARPFAVDLRSARATPAPPVVMAGYSARLAMATTVTGLMFSGLAQLDDVRYAVSIAVILLLWSAYRLERAAQRWGNPVIRSRVVSTVAGG